MSAMRLVPPEELIAELEALGCSNTGDATSSGVAYWKNNVDETFQVPPPDAHSGKYSDWVVGKILIAAGAKPPHGENFH